MEKFLFPQLIATRPFKAMVQFGCADILQSGNLVIHMVRQNMFICHYFRPSEIGYELQAAETLALRYSRGVIPNQRVVERVNALACE
jgi:hypothetical protein